MLRFSHPAVLAVLLLAAARPALAQLPAVISAPIEEGISRRQITHQGVTSLQMAEGKSLAGQMTRVSGQIKGIIDKTQALHDQWYSSLLQISDGVRRYRRVQEIYDLQAAMLGQYAAVRPQLTRRGLTADQAAQAGTVYAGLLQENVGLISELLQVLTSGRAKMTDPERLDFINSIADRMARQQGLLNYFTSKCQALGDQQTRQARDNRAMQVLLRR